MRQVFFVTDKDGQVGRALLPALAPLGNVIAMDRADCDLTDPDAITRAVRAARPSVIVNAAAYTAVDKAESDRDTAFAVNGRAPGILAELAAEQDAVLIHYSTDYVFDGKNPVPYLEDDPAGPLSVYGASKYEGEEAVRAALARHLILRTSWVFSPHGGNFLKTMLKLAAERDRLDIVADQIGAPTSAQLIAECTARIAQAAGNAPWGTYHLTAAGQTSWHGYAAFLIAEARKRGFPVRIPDDALNPIPASAYPAAARRPANSRLDTGKLRNAFALDLPPWQDGVQQVLGALIRS